MRFDISELTRRSFEWFRRRRRLAVALMSALVLAGLVPYLVFATTFTRPAVFLQSVGIGSSTPSYKLTLYGSDDNDANSSNTGSQLAVEGDGHGIYMRMKGGIDA